MISFLSEYVWDCIYMIIHIWWLMFKGTVSCMENLDIICKTMILNIKKWVNSLHMRRSVCMELGVYGNMFLKIIFKSHTKLVYTVHCLVWAQCFLKVQVGKIEV